MLVLLQLAYHLLLVTVVCVLVRRFRLAGFLQPADQNVLLQIAVIAVRVPLRFFLPARQISCFVIAAFAMRMAGGLFLITYKNASCYITCVCMRMA